MVIDCRPVGVEVGVSGVPRRFRFGPFEADLETGELRKNGRKLHLQEKPFQVLVALLEEQGTLVSREALHQRLWPADTFVDFDNGLNTAVSKLREALGDSADEHRYFETLVRRGYRFVSPVEQLGIPSTPHQRELDIRIKHIGTEVAVVEMAGRISFGTECQQIEWLTGDLLRENQKKIIFDLSWVTQVDSTGIGIIVVCSGKVREAGGELRVAGARGIVEAAFKTSKVDRIVALYPNAAAALEGFTGSKPAPSHSP
jgi:anti-anti-sigma factor